MWQCHPEAGGLGLQNKSRLAWASEPESLRTKPVRRTPPESCLASALPFFNNRVWPGHVRWNKSCPLQLLSAILLSQQQNENGTGLSQGSFGCLFPSLTFSPAYKDTVAKHLALVPSSQGPWVLSANGTLQPKWRLYFRLSTPFRHFRGYRPLFFFSLERIGFFFLCFMSFVFLRYIPKKEHQKVANCFFILQKQLWFYFPLAVSYY